MRDGRRDSAEAPPSSGAPRRPDAERGFLSVGTKLGVAVVLVVTVASAVVFFRVSQRERDSLVESKRVAADMVADLFAASLGAPLDFGDKEAVEAELGHLVQNKDVSFVSVWQAGQDTPFAERVAGGPRPQGSTERAPERTRVHPTFVEVARNVAGGEGRPVGTTVIHFSLDRENAAYEVNRQRILWLCLLLALGTMTVLLLVSRVSVVGPIDALLSAVRRVERGQRGAEVRVFANDEIGRLARAFESMRTAIFDREERLAEANANLRELFDHMRQAIVVFDEQGTVTGTQSRQAAVIFGEGAASQQHARDLLYPGVGDWDPERRAFEEWLTLAFEVTPEGWDELLSLAPREVRLSGGAGERVLSLDFQPVVRDGAIHRVMLLATDVTEQFRLEREVHEQGERHARQLATLRRLVSGGGQLFVAFLGSARQRLERAKSLLAPGPTPLARLDDAFQTIHTLKGEAASFEMTEITGLLEGVESRLSSLREQARDAPSRQAELDGDLGSALDGVEKLLNESEELFIAASPSGRAALEQVTVRRSDLDALSAIAQKQGGELELISERLRACSVGEHVGPLIERAPAWAEAIGKRARLELEGRETRIPEALGRVLPGVVTHLVKNAIAHGIERPEQRRAGDKLEVGTVGIIATVASDRPRIEVWDDGRGVEKNPVLAQAVAKGDKLSVETANDGSFRVDGANTSDDALSGRGMGLAAVVRELEAVGYHLLVEAREPCGTRFILAPGNSQPPGARA